MPGTHPWTLPSLIRGVCSLQPPWGAQGRVGAAPPHPSLTWHKGPASPTCSFCSLFSLPRGCDRGGCWFRCLFLFLLMIPRRFLAVAGVFLFPLARGRGRCIPRKQYFLITCQKNAAKEPRAPCPQSPAGTTGLFLYGNSSRGPTQPRQGFLLLSAILKTRNKRIFNEPPRGRACALFGVQGWSSPSRAPDPQGLSLPLPSRGREKGASSYEPGSLLGRLRLEANSAATEGKDFPGMGKEAPGEVSWVLVRFGIQRRAPCTLQGHFGLGSTVAAEGHSSHSHQPLL